MMDAPVIVHGNPAAPIDLPITQGPATGYAWSLDLPAGVTRVEDGPPPVAPPPDGRMGAPSGAHLRVAAPAGRYRITARLVRPWAQDNPARLVVIDLVVE